MLWSNKRYYTFVRVAMHAMTLTKYGLLSCRRDITPHVPHCLFRALRRFLILLCIGSLSYTKGFGQTNAVD